MTTISISTAKTHLSRLVRMVETGAEAEIIILRRGHPAARLVALHAAAVVSKRVGLLEGLYPVMSQEEFDADNEEIAALFYGEDEEPFT